MGETQQVVERMRAVTIACEYGSGGDEIAAHLAGRLGWHLLDHAEIVARVAHRLGVMEEEADAHDERVESLASRIFIRSVHGVPASLGPIPPIPSEPTDQAYREALRQVVEAATSDDQVVIAGHGGQMILADRRDALHLYVVASLEQRVSYVARHVGLGEIRARAHIRLKDRDHDRYLQAWHRRRVDDPHLYDLVVNTSLLDINSAVALIGLALERKAIRLRGPAEGLGLGGDL